MSNACCWSFIRSGRRASARLSASFQPARRRPRKGGCMKKTNEKHGKTITRTIEQIENRRITRAEREGLKRVAALPDEQIDTSDIPEVKDRTGWVRVHEHPEHPQIGRASCRERV